MLGSVAFSAITLAFGVTASASQCRDVPGAELVLGDDSKKFVIMGERHGTAEIPPLFGDLVCLAALSSPIVVGLEMETDQQQSLDAYMASTGGQADIHALLQERHWRSRDGRASEAMFHLIENLRRLRQAGRRLLVLAFMRSADSPEGRELGMALAWKDGLAAHPTAKLLALVGSVHAEREPLGLFVPAAHALPPGQTITLSYFPSDRRGVAREVPAEFRWPRYDRWYSTGQRFTSSPPAGVVFAAQP
jgi:hypothetical protein